ncbi:MAG: DEAD/DEAH box helicase, partial [Halobacteriales archaeon]|nr:DEAD/DEAH box helicase [Halobacteriales archaeon]
MEVAQVVPDFAEAFPFDEFNRMQREAVPALLESDDNVVASAPTASGKTALAELAICRTLRAGGTALFIAPLRALTNEKEREWGRFEDLGYSVYVVTGERELNPRRAARADVLVMTPEKADSATRKHDSRRYGFVTDVDLVIIDEVHLLDSDSRGSVLEVTVSRFRRLCDPRIVALSATMPNVEDVAAWLDAPPDATFQFGDDYRPVPLHADVKTYSRGENAFADKYRRLYRAIDLAEPHLREDGQALVFVASRQDTVQAAKKARDVLAERDVPIGARGDYDLHNAARQLSNDPLRQSVVDGVAFHHAGLSADDKNRVESWFRDGTVDLLFSTSTLAWGVNLPARCVVIRDTKLHDPLEGEVDMSPIDVLQMLGRAGRPGYDDVGYGWVVTAPNEADRYRALLREGTPVESRLAEDLDA